ncbi:unnamed protein product, partial [Didymodactylos carnosus]
SFFHSCNNSIVTDEYLPITNNNEQSPLLKSKVFLTDPSTTTTTMSSNFTDELALSYLKQTCDQQCQTDDVDISVIRKKTNDQEIQTIFSPSLQHELTIVPSTSSTKLNDYPKIEHDEFATKITYDNIADYKLEDKMPRSSSIESGLIDCSNEDEFCLIATTANSTNDNSSNQENDKQQTIIDQTNEDVDQVLPCTPSVQLIENDVKNETQEDEQTLEIQLTPTTKRLWSDIVDETANDDKQKEILSTKSENNDTNLTKTVQQPQQQSILTNGYHNETDQTTNIQSHKTLTKPRVTSTIDHLPPQTDNRISSSSSSSLSPTTPTAVTSQKMKPNANKPRHHNNIWYSYDYPYDYGYTNGKENNYYYNNNNSSHSTKKDQIKTNGTATTTLTSSTATTSSKQLVDNTSKSSTNTTPSTT